MSIAVGEAVLNKTSNGWKYTTFSAIGLWLVVFSVLAARRWVCSVPWSDRCILQLGSNFEAAVLFLWVDDWEAILTGLLALAAALIGLWVATSNERIKDQQLHLAARGSLSHHLGDISRHLREASLYIQAVYGTRDGTEIPKTKSLGPAPELPWTAVTALTQLIVTSTAAQGRYLSEYINLLQVYYANLRDIPYDLAAPNLTYGTWNLDSIIVKAIEADAGLSPLYEYARFRSEKLARPERKTILNSMAVLGFDDSDFEDAFELLNEKYPAT